MQSSGQEQRKNTTFTSTTRKVIKTTHQQCKSGHYFNTTSLHRDLHSPRIIQSNPARVKQIQNRIKKKQIDWGILLSSGLQNVLPHREFQKNESIFYIIIRDRSIHQRNRNRSEEICKLEESEQLQKRTELANIEPPWTEGRSGSSSCWGRTRGCYTIYWGRARVAAARSPPYDL
jgi:hypothetical protein